MKKYEPKREPKSHEDLQQATEVATEIIEAFVANFQNDIVDCAHMITDRFELRRDD